MMTAFNARLLCNGRHDNILQLMYYVLTGIFGKMIIQTIRLGNENVREILDMEETMRIRVETMRIRVETMRLRVETMRLRVETMRIRMDTIRMERRMERRMKRYEIKMGRIVMERVRGS